MDVLGFFVILVGLVFGIVGLVLGATVEKRGAGFFLGLLLGPVGWIIVLLLPRDQESKEVSTAQKTEPKKRTDRPERNLESDQYKVWLGNKYNIKKNELFEKYEFDGNLFESLSEALSGADQKDRECEEKEEINYEKEVDYEEERRRRAEKEKTESDKANRSFILVFFAVLIAFVLIVFMGNKLLLFNSR